MTAEEIIRRAPRERWTPELVARCANNLPFDEKLKFLDFMRKGGWVLQGFPARPKMPQFN